MDILPIRDYSEHDVIPFFGFSGASANKGTFVTPAGSGLDLTQDMLFGDLSYIDQTVSAYFKVPNVVAPAASGATKSQVVGMLLLDHRTYDENGELLIFRPRKAAEMVCTVSGQATNVLTRGRVLYSGIVGAPGFGSGAAVADAGDGSLKVVAPYVYGSGQGGVLTAFPNPVCIGKFLGPKNSAGHAWLQFDCQD